MVKFILGKCGSGKTYEVFNRIKDKLNENCEEIILLVPEQFTFECEKALLQFCGAKSSLVKVCSFTKLSNIILNDLGGKKSEILDDNSKRIIIGQALKNTKDNLKYFTNCKINNDLCKNISAIVTELKQAGVTSSFIGELASTTNEYNFSAKLYDFSIIMNSYDAIIANRFLDPESLIDLAIDRLLNQNWFQNKIVFVDSFTGFTASQNKLVEQIIKNACEVNFSFCVDSLEPCEDMNVFQNIKREVLWVKNIAKKYSVDIEKPFKTERKGAEDLDYLERVLSGENLDTFNSDAPNIEICQADSIYSEIDYVAERISILVKNNGYRYKDFAVISANADDYKNTINSVFSKYNIPCYIDKRTSLRTLPLADLVLSAVYLILNFNTETLFRMAKTGLIDVSEQEISDIEDYVYIWNINGKKWFKEWDMNPNGFEKEIDNSDTLVYINSIRKKLTDPIIEFKNSLSEYASKNSVAIYNFLQKMKVPEKLDVYSEELLDDGNVLESQIQKESWDSVITVLDRISKCYQDDRLNLQEYYDVLLHNFIDETVGTVPQLTDEVIFGSADRIRTGFIKVAFLVGVNQGVFPVLNQPCGLLSTYEREKLILNGAKIPDRFINDIIENQYRFYNAAATPTDKVFFTYNSSGDNGQPSAVIDQILGYMPKVKVVEYSDSDLPEINEIVAPLPLFEKTVRNIGNEKSNDFRAFFEYNEEYRPKFKTINHLLSIGKETISRDITKKLYNNNLYISATKIDTFYKCKFSYFCRYGLKINSLKKAEISSLIRGTIAHYILEKVVLQNKDNITSLSREDAKIQVDEHTNEYFDILGVDTKQLGNEFNNNINSIKILVLDLIMQIVDEFNKSDFKILECELEIGKNAEVKPLTFECNNNNSVSVTGKIDRVDYYLENDKLYLRVIDYKTNSKTFELSDVLYGQNLQMLVYLYSLLESKNGQATPAGVLYLPIKRIYEENERSKMNGLLLKDTGIVSHMAETPHEFLPARITKGQSFDRHSKVIEEKDFNTVFNYIREKIIAMGNSVFSGDISVVPTDGCESEACKYCEFKATCKKDITGITNKVKKLNYSEILEEMKPKETEAE